MMNMEIAVLIPVYHHINHRLMTTLVSNGIAPIVTVGTSDIALARSILLTNALELTNAKRFLWLDADMVFFKEEDLHIMLSQLDEPLVSGLYVNSVGTPCVWPAPSTPRKLPDEGLVDIHGAGFGCVSMHREVLERMCEKTHKIGNMPGCPNNKGWPLCFPIALSNADEEVLVTDPRASSWLTEDMAFFWRARKAGFSPKLQCDVRLGHLKEIPIPVGVNPASLRSLAVENIKDGVMDGDAK